MVGTEEQNPIATSEDDSIRALEALIIDNVERQQLEELLSPFNIFEAVAPLAFTQDAGLDHPVVPIDSEAPPR